MLQATRSMSAVSPLPMVIIASFLSACDRALTPALPLRLSSALRHVRPLSPCRRILPVYTRCVPSHTRLVHDAVLPVRCSLPRVFLHSCLWHAASGYNAVSTPLPM